MMYDVVLYWTIVQTGKEIVTLELSTRLPFPPTPDIILGLDPESHFEYDESAVKSVMWQIPQQRFLVRVNETRYAGDEKDSSGLPPVRACVKRALDLGWRLSRPFVFASAQDASYNDGQIVRLSDGYITCGEIELWVLAESGEFHELTRFTPQRPGGGDS